jgi:hypothetical protein
MIKWLMAVGLVLGVAAPILAQTGKSPFLVPDPYSSPTPQWNKNQLRQPETQEQARKRWEREDRERFGFEQSNPSDKPGFEPSRPQQQQPKPNPDRRSR